MNRSSVMPAAGPHADCVFCSIVAGKIPSARVYEDEHVLAFFDINPLAEGHTLLIPRRHYETIYEMPSEVTAGLCGVLPRLARAVRAAVNAQGINILQNNGSCSGQVVMHVHFHIIPRVPGDGLGYRWPAGKYPGGRLEEVHNRVTKAFEDDKT
jgi:histidine triad (HIT) family protein